MRRLYLSLFVCVFYVSLLFGQAQENVRYLKRWKLDAVDFTQADTISADTSRNWFPVYMRPQRVEMPSPLDPSLGNNGSPTMSNSFIEQVKQLDEQFIFKKTLAPYLLIPDSVSFYNTSTPHSKVFFVSNNKRKDEENTLEFLHTRSLDETFNVGIQYNLVAAEGIYDCEKMLHHNFGFFTNYTGERYAANLVVTLNRLNTNENGGIDTTDFDVNSSYVPVRLPNQKDEGALGISTAKSRLSNFNILGVQSVKFGTYEYYYAEDSTKSVRFKPKYEIAHKLKFERDFRTYTDGGLAEGIYSKFYLDSLVSYDSTYFHSLANTVQFRTLEQMIPGLKLGLRASLTNELCHSYNFKQYIVLDNEKDYHNNFIQGGLFSKTGKGWKWDANALMYFEGRNAGNFSLDFKLDKYFRKSKDSLMNVSLSYKLSSMKPSIYEESYYSNRISWSVPLDNRTVSLAKGSLSIPSWKIKLGGQLATIGNHVYWGQDTLPHQSNAPLSVLSVFLHKGFSFWKIKSDHRLLFQQVSNEDILHLPQISYYMSTYFEHIFFRNVLHAKIGFDVAYNSEYTMYAYMPATGMFLLQNQAQTGNFPVVDVYANCRIKNVQFFLKYERASAAFSDNFYYVSRFYPIPDQSFKIGIFWTFFN